MGYIILIIIIMFGVHLATEYITKQNYKRQLKQKMDDCKNDEQLLDFVYNNFKLKIK